MNVYVHEYLNEQLLNEFDHILENKERAPKGYYNLIFTKLDSNKFTLRIYSYSKNDSIELLQFRIGELGLYKKLRVNRKDLKYSWKLAGFNSNIGPSVKIGERIPLLYYATAIKDVRNDKIMDAFCNVPNILNNRGLIENKGKIEHYFEVGVELVGSIE